MIQMRTIAMATIVLTIFCFCDFLHFCETVYPNIAQNPTTISCIEIEEKHTISMVSCLLEITFHDLMNHKRNILTAHLRKIWDITLSWKL